MDLSDVKSIGNFDALMKHASQDGSGTLIELDGKDSIHFEDMKPTDLRAETFIF